MILCPHHRVPLIPEGEKILRCPESGCYAVLRSYVKPDKPSGKGMLGTPNRKRKKKP